MLYLDESGDDGKKVETNSELFTIAIYDDGNDSYKKCNEEIRKFIKFMNKNMKWNKLNKEQKSLFLKYVDLKHEYEIYAIAGVKSIVNNFSYFEICKFLFFKIILNNVKVIYKGVHLKNLFHRLHALLKNFNKKFSFYESKNDQYLGVEIADLYAGYVRYCITNNLKINNSINYYEFE